MEQISLLDTESEILKVHLGGEDTIDASLLADIIENFITLVDDTKSGISKETPVQLRVKAFQPGSFEVLFEAVTEIFASDKAANSLTVLSVLSSGVIGLFKLAKHIKGNKAAVVDENSVSVTIENAEGAEVTVARNVYNTYIMPGVNDTVAEVFDRLESDNTRDNLEVSNATEKVSINKSEFIPLSRPYPMEKLSNRIVTNTITDILIQIKKLDLMGNSKWEFYFNTLIKATIQDEDFLNRVRSGEITFKAGDSLNVDLRFEHELDDRGMIIAGSERYFVERVNDVCSFRDPAKNQINFDEA